MNNIEFIKDNYNKNDRLLINLEYFEIDLDSILNYYDLVLLLPKLKTLKILYRKIINDLKTIKIYNFIINNKSSLLEILPFLQKLPTYEYNSKDLKSFFKSELENLDISSMNFDKKYVACALILYYALYKNNIKIVFIE